MKEKGKLIILGNLGNKGGSKIHRVLLPLNYLNNKEIEINGNIVKIEVIFTENGDETFIKKLEISDIFYNNFSANEEAWKIGVLLTKYNVKLIEDIDDVFYLNPENPMYNRFNAGNVKRHLVLADTIIVTNERLKEHVKRFTEKRGDDDFLPIHISPNHLPNEGQWEYKPKELHDGKVRFGLFGSISHYPDWKLLKGMIKILGNNKKFANKAKFVLAGCGNDVYWKEIKSWFKGLKCEVDYIPTAPIDTYMSLLDHVDVVLAPLVDDEFSWNKSSLKIAECAMKDIFLVGSVPYAGKDLSCGIAIDPEDWQKWIYSLLENNNWYNLGKEFGEKNRKAMDFNQRIESLTQAIAYCYTSKYKELNNFQIWGITFDENQYTEFTPFFNQTKEKAWRFEYNPIIELSNKMDNNDIYYGVFSWKFPMKTGISKKILEKVITGINVDVIGLAPNFFHNNYLQFSYKQHPCLEQLLKKVCDKLELELPKDVKKAVYSNFFLAKGKVYKQYVNEIIIPALNYIENEIWEEVNIDAQYKSGLSSEQLLKYTGLEYYNYVTFILERMLSIWLHNHPEISFKQIG